MDGGVKTASLEGGPLPIWPKDTITSFEDLEIALDAAARVNRHLHSEAQAVVAELRRTRKERDAWQRHAQQLARKLAAERRRFNGGGSGGGGVADEQQQQQQHKADGDEVERGRRRHGAHEEEAAEPLDPAAEQEAAALAQLPPAAEAAIAGAPPPPGAFEWPGSAASAAQLKALVAKGRAAGWIADPGAIDLGPLLGAGAFGETHRARWRGADVAVKKVRVASEQDLVSFLREVECLASVRHPAVVPFLGAVVGDAGRCWLLSEFMPGGNLAAYLHGAPAAPARRVTLGGGGGGNAQSAAAAAAGAGAGAAAASAPGGGGGGWFGFGGGPPLVDRLERALEIAGALAALEAHRPRPILHRDVKPSNVFLDAAGRARLGDFGLARVMPSSAATLTGETGTYLYMAPEVVRHEVYDSKADVWSFGVLLSEAASRAVPYAQTYLTPVQVAMAVADEALRPEPPGSLPASVLVVCNACCDYDPGMRPDFGVVAEMLASAVKEVRAREAAAAAGGGAGVGSGGGGLLGRLLGGAGVPESWVSVLAQAAAAGAGAAGGAGVAGGGGGGGGPGAVGGGGGSGSGESGTAT